MDYEDESVVLDTMPLGVKTPYDEIYDDVKADMDLKKFDYTTLFMHCMQTCNRIFSVAEYRPGKDANNIPEDLIEDIGLLYDEKYCEIHNEDVSNEKYEYYTSYNNVSDSDKISMYDLAGCYTYANESNKDSVEYNIKYIYMNFLPKYFGYEYDDKLSREIKYELIRLTKILYDCKNEFDKDLGILLRSSRIQFNPKINSMYKDCIDYIKTRIIIRKCSPDYQVSFEMIMKIERFANAIKSFMRSLNEMVSKNILEYVSNKNSKKNRYITEKVCRVVIDNLADKEVSNGIKYNKPETIQLYAYAHFILKEATTVYCDEEDSVDIGFDNDVYDRIDDFCNTSEIKNVDDVESFVREYRNDLLAILFLDDVDNNLKRRRKESLIRNIDSYKEMVRIYSRWMNKDDKDRIELREVIILIGMYEMLVSKHVDIPLYSGYTDGRYKKQKIKRLLMKMENYERSNSHESILTESEFYLASLWLIERMNMLMNCKTSQMMSLINQMQKSVLEYCLKQVPLLNKQSMPEERFFLNLDALREQIIPERVMRDILDEANML